ncbi:hypothetical protein ACHWQZ_G004404 [Mnemiopsis leidyi]
MFCCLQEKGVPCTNAATVNVTGKKLNKALGQNDHGLTLNSSLHHSSICVKHKELLQSTRPTRRKRRAPSDNNPPVPVVQQHHQPPPSPVDETNIMDNLELELGHLPLLTLRKCRKYFKLQVKTGTNRQQLAETIIKHFRNMPVKEKEVIDNFVKAVSKRRRENDDSKDNNESFS